jgi:flagellar assembly FapA-like protein
LENDLLIEYIKPRKGKPGRNCRGEFIEQREPVVANTPVFNVSDKIEVVESEESTQYRAKNSGHIVFENNTYDIKVEVEITEISFKTTGSIEAGVNTDVSINVKEKDAFKDAIGAGMEVEVNEINVDGNVGSNAKIKAKKVKIEGQTHQSSYIEADEVKVNIHKGKIKGQKIEVTRLEQGVIEGEYVEVFQAAGGKIIAKEVVIDTLASHVDIIASSKIEIKNFKGEENTLTISPVLYEEDKDALQGNEEEIKVQKRKIRTLQEEVNKKQAFLNENAAAIADIKKRLAHYKQSGTKMPVSFVTKFKEFQELQTHLLSLKQELKQNEEACELLREEHQTFQTNILESRIINHDKYTGHNEIRFKLVDPDIELYLVPKGGDHEKCFMLKENEDDASYTIVATEIGG